MSGIFRVAVMSTLVLGLAACAEKPQESAGHPIRGSTPNWQGPATAFTVPEWKVGDERSWEAHMRARALAQNEHVRLGVSR